MSDKDVLANRCVGISIFRAPVNREIINNLFDNPEKKLENIPPSNICNYDEINLGDDSGAIKIIIRRGTKYPDQIRNATKACTSIMVAGNAAGEIVPVVYKLDKLWQSWMDNGPDQAHYNITKSDWFDYRMNGRIHFQLMHVMDERKLDALPNRFRKKFNMWNESYVPTRF